MPTWVKVVLIVVVAGFILLAAGIFVAARWVKSQGAALQRQGKAVIAEARAFGQGKDAEACLAESFARLDRASGFIGEAKVKIFLQHCLQTATVSDQTCEGVPRPTDLLDTAQWTLAECAKRGRTNDQRCTRLIGALQVHCVTRKGR
jgi:hypothetical protein